MKKAIPNSTNLEFKKQAAKAVKLAHLELMEKSFEIKTIHLLLSMLKDENSVVTLLSQFNIDYETV